MNAMLDRRNNFPQHMSIVIFSIRFIRNKIILMIFQKICSFVNFFGMCDNSTILIVNCSIIARINHFYTLIVDTLFYAKRFTSFYVSHLQTMKIYFYAQK